MRRLMLGAALVAAIAVVSVDWDVNAQQFGNRGGGGGVITLIQNESVQKEIKMTEDQVKDLGGKAKEVGDALRKKSPGFGKDVTKEAREEYTKLSTEENAKFMKVIEEKLKPEQLKRFKQIQVQQMGMRAYSDENIVKELKLTDSQKEKIKNISEDLNKDTQELFKGGKGGFNKEAFAKMGTLRKEAQEKIDNVLNDDQKETWKELTGEAFQIQFPNPFGKGKDTKKDTKKDD